MTEGGVRGAALLIVVAAFILFFIFRDARARDANPVLWAIGLLAAGYFIHPVALLLGLAVYLATRPKGKLDRCPHCSAPYLHWLARCPKCKGPLKRDCHRCHATAPYTSTTCPECGAFIQ